MINTKDLSTYFLFCNNKDTLLHYKLVSAKFKDSPYDLTGDLKQDFLLSYSEYINKYPNKTAEDHKAQFLASVDDGTMTKAVSEGRLTADNVQNIYSIASHNPKAWEEILQEDNKSINPLIEESIAIRQEHENKMADLTEKFNSGDKDLKGDCKHYLLMDKKELQFKILSSYQKDPLLKSIRGSDYLYDKYMTCEKVAIKIEVSRALDFGVSFKPSVFDVKPQSQDLKQQELETFNKRLPQLEETFKKQVYQNMMYDNRMPWIESKLDVIKQEISQGRVTAAAVLEYSKKNCCMLKDDMYYQMKEIEFNVHSLLKHLKKDNIVSFDAKEPLIESITNKSSVKLFGKIESVVDNQVVINCENGNRYFIPKENVKIASESDLQRFNQFYHNCRQEFLSGNQSKDKIQSQERTSQIDNTTNNKPFLSL